MDESKIIETIKKCSQGLPKFPDGRIDYSHSSIAPIINIFLRYEGKILLVKRSNKVSSYHGKWNGVAGYLDEFVPIKKKMSEELIEEVGITDKQILHYHIGEPYQFTDKITWIVHPILVDLKIKPEIKLDWEHTEYRWIKPEELNNFDTVPNLDKTLANALK